MHMLFSTGRKRRWAWAGSGVAASGGSSVRSPLYGPPGLRFFIPPAHTIPDAVFVQDGSERSTA